MGTEPKSLDHLLGVAQEDQAEWGLELRLVLLSFPDGSRQWLLGSHWALLSGSQPTVHSSRLWEAARGMAQPLPASKNMMSSGWAGPKLVPPTTPHPHHPQARRGRLWVSGKPGFPGRQDEEKQHHFPVKS